MSREQQTIFASIALWDNYIYPLRTCSVFSFCQNTVDATPFASSWVNKNHPKPPQINGKKIAFRIVSGYDIITSTCLKKKWQAGLI